MGGFAGFIAGGFLYPIPRRKPAFTFICLESELKTGFREIRDPKGRLVLLMKKQDGSLAAMSTVCTHLGCNVFFRPGKHLFECPCHQGFFDENGGVISGPPQRPLDRYSVEVRKGKVFVQFI